MAVREWYMKLLVTIFVSSVDALDGMHFRIFHEMQRKYLVPRISFLT